MPGYAPLCGVSASFKIAVITTEYRHEAHADVIVSRWLEPFATDAKYGWGKSATTIVSMYADQIPENDMSAEVCRKHGIVRYETVAEALTLGGEELAVDGILLIGEHGNYPLNEFQQKLYPRKELFDQVVEVFRRSGRVVPLFLDKHLSWNPAWIQEMYWTIRDMQIPFFGGTSLTHTPYCPPITVPDTCDEVVAIYWNSLEAYLFHSLEVVQSLIEKRHGGAREVVSLTAWRDEEAWRALDRGEFSQTLLLAAARCFTAEAEAAMKKFQSERGPCCVFQLRYRDGFKETHFMQTDIVRKWCLAFGGDGGPATATYVETGGRAEFFPHFAMLNCQIEKFLLSGVPPVPLERLYFTSMATALCMHALKENGRPIPTPLLRVPAPPLGQAG